MLGTARRTLVAAVIAAGMTVGGVATAAASEPDDQDDIVSELTGQLSEGSDRVRDVLDVGGSSDDGSSEEGASGLKQLEQALTEGADPIIEIGDERLLGPVNELVCELTDDELELLELDPFELLGDCPVDTDVEKKADQDDKHEDDKHEDDEHAEKDDHDSGKSDDDDSGPDDERDDDDSGTVPVGGIETGGGGTATGGTATDGGGPALGVLGGGLLLSGAGAALAWRRAGRLG